MNQSDGINELGNHLLDDAGAVIVVIGEHAETGIEPAALFAGRNQRQVERGQPVESLQ